LNNGKSFRYGSDRLHKDSSVMAVQGLAPGSFKKSKNEQAPPPEILRSPNGYIEYRRPWFWTWPIVLCASHAGSMVPTEIPDRTEGVLEPERELDTLVEEIWNEFGKSRVAAPPLISSKLHPVKMDPNTPRHLCCQVKNQAALEAWDAYHGWIAEALQRSVATFGFALLLDIGGQSYRRMVTEIGYIVDLDDFLLFDSVLDKSTRPTSVEALLRGAVRPAGGRPGGLSSLLRGAKSLGGLLESRNFRCTPSPATPEPAQAIPLFRARGKMASGTCSPEELAAVTYKHDGYTLRRYCAPATLTEEESPLSPAEQQALGGTVAAIQLVTSWLGVRNGIMERRLFGEHLCWAAETLLKEWVGWVMPADTRG